MRNTQEYTSPVQNFEKGTISGVVDRKRGRPKHFKDALNLFGRVLGAASIRPGSRDLSDVTLPSAPHSLLKYYAAGGGKLYIGAGAQIYEVLSTTYALVTLPLTPSTNKWSHTNLNGTLIATQLETTGNKPLMYDGVSWKIMTLPGPDSASLTLAPATAAGNLTPNKDYWYRLRWLYKNGSSVTLHPKKVTMGVTDNEVAISTIPIGTRDDYLGWRLERTEAGATAAGPYYWAADGTAAGYTDDLADSLLNYRADEGVHGEPLTMNGVVSFDGRLWGWYGAALYPSQVPGGIEGDGLANFDPELTVYCGRDDGDTIQCAIVHGNELIVFKRRSVWRVISTGTDSWDPIPVGSDASERGGEAGAVGPRAACAIGNRIFFWADAGIFIYESGVVKPAGWIEMGKYMGNVNSAIRDDIVLVNQIGDFVLMFNPQLPYGYNSHFLLYDARLDQWWPCAGWYAKDALVIKDGSLGETTLVFCDSRAADATGVFATRHTTLHFSVNSNHSYAVSMDPDGTQLWTVNGVLIDNSASAPGTCRIEACTDGGSGFYYIYNEVATGERIMLRHLDENGATTAGFPLQLHAGGAGHTTDNVRVVPDWAGGCYVIYSDRVAGITTTYCRRVNANGTFAWAERNLTAVRGTYITAIGTSLNAGGDLILGTSDFFSTGTSEWWRIDRAAGTVTWTAVKAGLNMSNSGTLFEAEDGLGVWYKRTDGSHCALIRYSDGVTVSPGAQTATATGAPLSVVFASDACSDAAGGMLAATGGTRTSPPATNGMWVARVDPVGNLVWGGPTDITNNQSYSISSIAGSMQCVPDGQGGVIVVWGEVGPGGGSQPQNVLAVRLDSTGARVWGPSAIVIATWSSATGVAFVRATTDGSGGAIVTWRDSRAGSNTLPYGARVLADGTLPWTANGVQLSNRSPVTNQGEDMRMVFAGAAAASIPVGSGSGYHVWAGFDGFRDEKSRLREGGNAVPWFGAHPKIDDADILGVRSNQPKEFGRIQFYFNTTPASISAALTTDPDNQVATLQLVGGQGGNVWGDDTGVTGDNDLVWDDGEWAEDDQAPLTSAFPIGTIGQRYQLTVSGTADGDMQYQGFELDAVLTPERRTDQ